MFCTHLLFLLFPHLCCVDLYKRWKIKGLYEGAVFLSGKELLDAVAAEVIVCKKCDLWKSRKKAVPGEGNPQSEIMFIGEAPGQTEDSEGKPFVGAAGKFLDTLISEPGLVRKDVFICNIVKCRPPRNREPRPAEIQACTPYLNRQIKIIKPKFIVALGTHSTAYIFQKAGLPFSGITKGRGKFYQARILGMEVTVFPTFHPAAALYMARYKEQLTSDFNLLKQEIGKRGIV
jgi:uracil-DNA glycosylase family 4